MASGRRSAGILLHRDTDGVLEVLLVHPGGPFWARKDDGAWSIPKGEHADGDDPQECARREFQEETGLRVQLTGVAAVHSNFHNPDRQTVGVWFHGDVIGGELEAGDDLDAVAYFPLDAPPERLAFPTDRLVIDELRERAQTRTRGTAAPIRVTTS